ncbi:type II secretion system F family protein [Streptomyces sp. NPDC002073]
MSGPGVAGALPLLLAVLCAAALWLPDARDGLPRRARLLLVGGGPVPEHRPGWKPWADRLRERAKGRQEWACPVAGLLLGGATGSVLPFLAGVVAVPLVRRWLRTREAAVRRRERAAEVVAVCGAVAGELRAGLQPGQALTAALRDAVGGPAGSGGTDSAVLAAAAFGGDVPQALRQAAREPGAAGLAGMAACWRVSVDGGAGLAAGLDRLERALRAERDQRETLRAQMAGARSTAVVLALLPAVALLIGTALGADPLRVLLHTPLGLGCLCVGALLEALGFAWAWRIVRTGERA